MPDRLILKRHPEYDDPEAYNVLFKGRHVGRIYWTVSHAPREGQFMRPARATRRALGDVSLLTCIGKSMVTKR